MPGYDAFASWYDDWVAAPEDDLVAASLFEMIGRVEAQRLLDLGCGEGRISRAGRSRNDVVAVDLSAPPVRRPPRPSPPGGGRAAPYRERRRPARCSTSIPMSIRPAEHPRQTAPPPRERGVTAACWREPCRRSTQQDGGHAHHPPVGCYPACSRRNTRSSASRRPRPGPMKRRSGQRQSDTVESDF